MKKKFGITLLCVLALALSSCNLDFDGIFEDVVNAVPSDDRDRSVIDTNGSVFYYSSIDGIYKFDAAANDRTEIPIYTGDAFPKNDYVFGFLNTDKTKLVLVYDEADNLTGNTQSFYELDWESESRELNPITADSTINFSITGDTTIQGNRYFIGRKADNTHALYTLSYNESNITADWVMDLDMERYADIHDGVVLYWKVDPGDSDDYIYDNLSYLGVELSFKNTNGESVSKSKIVEDNALRTVSTFPTDDGGHKLVIISYDDDDGNLHVYLSDAEKLPTIEEIQSGSSSNSTINMTEILEFDHPTSYSTSVLDTAVYKEGEKVYIKFLVPNSNASRVVSVWFTPNSSSPNKDASSDTETTDYAGLEADYFLVNKVGATSNVYMATEDHGFYILSDSNQLTKL